MSIQDDIREHMGYALQFLAEAVKVRNRIDCLERQAKHAESMARLHTSLAIKCKPPEPVRCKDAVRAGPADSYTENTSCAE